MSGTKKIVYSSMVIIGLLLLLLVTLYPSSSKQIVDFTFQFSKNINSLLLISVTANSILGLLVYRLWIWRNIVNKGTESLVPEKWMSSFEEKYLLLGEAIQAWSQFSKKNYSQIKELSEITNMLNLIIDEKERELSRHRDGFDSHLFRGFLAKFSAIHAAAIKDDRSDSKKKLEEIAWKLEDALEDCGVSVELVKQGDNYPSSGDLCSDNPKLLPNKDPKRSLQVAEILRQAYVLNTRSGRKIVLPAKVIIYEEAKEGIE